MEEKRSKNEKLFNINVVDKNGKVIGTVKRYGKLVKVDKYTKSKYKYQVRIAPKTFVWVESF